MNKQEKRNYHKSIIGSDLSKTTKMPCLSFNLSAEHCITGSKLVNVKGSVCYGCYALGGLYKVYGHIEKMKPKTDKIKNDLWVSSMVWLIENQLGNKDKSYFRWHDSGDIQSIEHLENYDLIEDNIREDLNLLEDSLDFIQIFLLKKNLPNEWEIETFTRFIPKFWI